MDRGLPENKWTPIAAPSSKSPLTTGCMGIGSAGLHKGLAPVQICNKMWKCSDLREIRSRLTPSQFAPLPVPRPESLAWGNLGHGG